MFTLIHTTLKLKYVGINTFNSDQYTREEQNFTLAQCTVYCQSES